MRLQQRSLPRNLMTLGILLASSPALSLADAEVPDDDVIISAMVDELQRSMAELALDDLPRPYFIQYRAQDQHTYTMGAANGALLQSEYERTRDFYSRVRVGSYELDNTNVGGRGFETSLPLDDDYVAIRHAIWRATDLDYKRAVETLTRKRAYLKDKNIEDPPDDFTPGKAIVVIESPAELPFHREEWEQNIRRLSARFKAHPQIQISGVSLFVGTVDDYIVNSEGVRTRTGDTGMIIQISGSLQADEGMHLGDSRTYLGERIDQLPPIEQMLADIDEMCDKLTQLSKAPTLDHYTGPVLFAPEAAGKVFESLLADNVCARPAPLGSGGRDLSSLEKKLDMRVLPRSFQVYDDP
ncbi:MAG: hypothetical protein JSU63_10965, partial [Phycisphaerales bacterium]